MYPRYCQQKIMDALVDTPIVIIAGPRQCGKTTLVKTIQQADWQYVTLDDVTQLDMAKRDPIGFVRDLTARHVILDEVQRVPELFLSIKQSVDEDRRPGRFLLTGSVNALLLPKVSDSLVGRMEVIPLLPLSACEMTGVPSTFFDKILSGQPPTSQKIRIKAELIDNIMAGGFPEPLARTNDTRRAAWYTQYIQGIIQKDIKELGHFEHLDTMPRLIRLLCNQVGQLVDYTTLAGRAGLSRQTMNRYLKILEQLFIFDTIPAWHRNENKRLIKTPKVHIVDSGLLCALKRINRKKLSNTPKQFGSLLESYAVCELRRLASWQEEPLYFYHYRDKDKVEVDCVVETLSGEVIGIEVKAKSTVKKQDFQGLERLKKIAGKDFLMGILLHDGDHANTYTDKIYSIPIGALWE